MKHSAEDMIISRQIRRGRRKLVYWLMFRFKMTTVTSAKCPLQAHKLRRKPLLHAVHHMNTTVENSQWQFLKVFFGNRIDGGCHSSTMGITVDFKFKVVYHLSHTPLCVRAKAWAEAAHSHQSDGGNERYLIRAKAQGSAVSSEWRRKSRECLLIGMRAGKSTLCFRVKEYRQDNPWKTLLPLLLPRWGEWQTQEGGAIQE